MPKATEQRKISGKRDKSKKRDKMKHSGQMFKVIILNNIHVYLRLKESGAKVFILKNGKIPVLFLFWREKRVPCLYLYLKKKCLFGKKKKSVDGNFFINLNLKNVFINLSL